MTTGKEKRMPAIEDLLALTPAALAEMEPPQIDEFNALLSGERQRLIAKEDRAADALQRSLLQKKESVRSGRGVRQRWPLTTEGAETLAHVSIKNATTPPPRELLRGGLRDGAAYRKGIQEALSALQAVREEVGRLSGPQEVLHGEWGRRGGWSRFVTVPDGHMHRGRECHTIRPTTVTNWHPELSGRSEAEAVKAHGPYLCSHCYEGAPTEWKLDPAEEKRKAEADTKCPQSLKYVQLSDSMARRVSKYAVCPECGERVSVTSTWKLKTHPKKGEGGR